MIPTFVLSLAVVSSAFALHAGPAVSQTPDAPSSHQSRTSVKKYFKVFRRAKLRKDTIRLTSGTKRARARLAAADSRLVAQTGDFKVYLVQSGSELCIWLIQSDTAASGCGDVAALRSMTPPALWKVGDKEVITIVPVLDGVMRAVRVASDGSSHERTIRNNVFVEVSSGGGHVSWTAPVGPVQVRVPEAGSL